MNLDNYIFNLCESLLTSILALFSLVLISYVVYFKFYESSDFNYQSNDFKAVEQRFKLLDLDSDITEQFHNNFNENIIQHIKQDRMHQPINCWHFPPPLLLGSCWFILNFVYWLREPINTPKDLIAWFSYVVCHIVVPIFTALWLYLFHPPGALKLFSFGIGIQNLAAVLTHLCFPNAPPWFIHYYGEDHEANYDILGYAAGLTRVDIVLGTYMNTNGFHISPIVFGALPSIHSAMAAMVFFFVSYYSRWACLKIAALCFIILQWWATIYLDHHWRLDLLLGLIYSIISFTILTFWKNGFNKVNEDFFNARVTMDFQKGSTMGMRVFRKTIFQQFFDPFS